MSPYSIHLKSSRTILLKAVMHDLLFGKSQAFRSLLKEFHMAGTGRMKWKPLLAQTGAGAWAPSYHMSHGTRHVPNRQTSPPISHLPKALHFSPQSHSKHTHTLTHKFAYTDGAGRSWLNYSYKCNWRRLSSLIQKELPGWQTHSSCSILLYVLMHWYTVKMLCANI